MKNYIRKMSLLLTVSSTVTLASSFGAFAAGNYVAEDNNLIDTIGNSATVGSNLSQPEAGWSRFTLDNSNIIYSGYGWSKLTKGVALTCTLGANLKFNFAGNGIRLVAPVWVSQSSNIEISIDGKVETFSECFNTGELQKRLVFEKLNLSNEEHTVVITNKEDTWAQFDAIDINEDGQLKPYTGESNLTFGDQISKPEAGWRRYTNRDKNINYIGDGWRYSFDDRLTNIYGDSVKFKFTGNDLRILGCIGSTQSKNIELSIDGVTQTISEYINSSYDNISSNRFIFEKLGLNDGEHTVVITNKSDAYMNIGAIDINEGGQLKPCTEESKLNLGDQISEPEAGWRRYTYNDQNLNYIGDGWSDFDDVMLTNRCGDSAKIKFTGNNLRILGWIDSVQSKNIELSIDGVTQTISEYVTYRDTCSDRLVFEKLGLNDGEHTVVITNKSDAYMNIGAIDINEGGQLIPCREKSKLNLGDQISEPEAGWRRYTYDDQNLNYIGDDWSNFGDVMLTNRYADSVKFKFTGSDLRILGLVGDTQAKEIELTIYGVTGGATTQIISEYIDGSYDTASNRLVFEKLDLNDGEHIVVITNKSDAYMNIGAIDINEDGQLKPFNEEATTDSPVEVNTNQVSTTTPAAVQVNA